MEKEKKRKGKRATKKVFASIPRVPSRCSYVKISKRLLGSYFRRDRRPKIGSVLSISHIWISKSFFPSFLFLFVFVYQTLEIVHWKWVSIYIYIFVCETFPLRSFFLQTAEISGSNNQVCRSKRIFEGSFEDLDTANHNFRDKLIYKMK